MRDRDRSARTPLALALGLVAGGLLAMLAGWRGAATTLFDAQQLPYLVSGGLGGLALVDLGATVLRIHHRRHVEARYLTSRASLLDAMARQAALRLDTCPPFRGTVPVNIGSAAEGRLPSEPEPGR